MATVLRSVTSSATRRLLFLSRSSFSTLRFTHEHGGAAAAVLRGPHLPRSIPSASWISIVGDYRISSFKFTRSFSQDTSKLPAFTDPDIENSFKDLLAASWDNIPESVINNTKKALSKATDDKAGKEALENLFRAAEASEEFGGVLVSLRMALDDLSGLTGENVVPLPDYLEDALKAAYNRYTTYLNSFGPEETYLQKKVETELGTKMIHLKMRCSGIGNEWSKITLIGTSGLAGSYVEQRA